MECDILAFLSMLKKNKKLNTPCTFFFLTYERVFAATRAYHVNLLIISDTFFFHYTGLIKRKGVFEHEQNGHSRFTPRMRKVSSGHLLSINTLDYLCILIASIKIQRLHSEAVC